MTRKTFLCLSLAAVSLYALAGCRAAGSGAASSAAPKNYAQILADARTSEYNEAYLILSPNPETGGYSAQEGIASDLDDETLASQADMMLQMLNLSPEELDNYAISISLMNIRSYAVAIIKPAEGKTDSVTKELQAYVDAQKQNMQTYLPDQYEIASNAKIVTAKSGEVILVCCEDADAVLSSIENGLAE